MGADENRLRELGLQLQFDLIQVHRTVTVLVSHFDARAQVDSIKFLVQSIQQALDHTDPGHDESWTVAAVGQGNDLDVFVMLRELTALRTNPLEALCTGDARMVLDALAVENGDFLHVLDPFRRPKMIIYNIVSKTQQTFVTMKQSCCKSF
jgi:hypothetical protein